VKGAATAILLLGRERLARGETADLIRAALAEYRADPADCRLKQAAAAQAGEPAPLKNPRHAAYYRELAADVGRLTQKWTDAKRQFNSLLELDNALIAQLKNFG
jgi:hypothetical protein